MINNWHIHSCITDQIQGRIMAAINKSMLDNAYSKIGNIPDPLYSNVINNVFKPIRDSFFLPIASKINITARYD